MYKLAECMLVVFYYCTALFLWIILLWLSGRITTSQLYQQIRLIVIRPEWTSSTEMIKCIAFQLYQVVYVYFQPRNAARLLSCVGHVLSSLQYDKIVEWLNKFLPPITQALSQAASSSPNMKVKMQIMDKLQMLTWLFDSLDVKKTEHLMKTSTQTQPVSICIICRY